MKRLLYIATGCLLLALWALGLLHGGGAAWIVAWFDVLGAIWAFTLGIGMGRETYEMRNRERTACFALGIGLCAVAALSFAAEVPWWLLIGNALVGVAFFGLAILPNTHAKDVNSREWRQSA